MPQAQHPRYRTSHTLVASPCRDQAAQLTIHTHSTCPELQAKSQRWRRHAPASVFFASDRWTDKWLFLQVRCDVTPFFPSPVLLRSLSSVFPCPQPLSDLLSDVFDGQWYSLCSSVPSALLQPGHLYVLPTGIVQPGMRKSSLHDNFPHHIAVLCLSTTCWSSFAAWPGLVPTTFLLPFPHTRVRLHISSQRPSCLVSEASSFTSCGQTTLMSTATCKRCHCGHLMPRSQVWTLHFLQVLSFVSIFASQRSASYTLSTAPFSICSSTLVPHKRPWRRRINPVFGCGKFIKPDSAELARKSVRERKYHKMSKSWKWFPLHSRKANHQR